MNKEILTLIREQSELRDENLQLKAKNLKLESRLEYAIHFKNFSHKSIKLINFMCGSQSASISAQAIELKQRFDEIKDKRLEIFAKYHTMESQHILAIEMIEKMKDNGLDPDEMMSALQEQIEKYGSIRYVD